MKREIGVVRDGVKTPSGAEIEAAARVIIGAMGLDEFGALVYSETGDRLFDVFASRDWPFLRIARTTLEELARTGQIYLVLEEVVARREEHRPDVAAALRPLLGGQHPALPQAGLDLQHAGQSDDEAPKRAAAPGLQRNVRPHIPNLDVTLWLQRASEMERRVCRIEIDGAAAGTGFLIAPDVVMTNWHVVEASVVSGTVGDITCRFDYVKEGKGRRSTGKVVALAAEGIVDSSPYAPAEITDTPDHPPPTIEQLDYALLRLAEPEGGKRGWITLPTEARKLDAGTPLLILQHPDGAPMKLALDTDSVIGLESGGTRLRYRTNTASGSSGSPCFTLNWELVALHHFGDPAWGEPVFNQGIPAELIARRLAGRKIRLGPGKAGRK